MGKLEQCYLYSVWTQHLLYKYIGDSALCYKNNLGEILRRISVCDHKKSKCQNGKASHLKNFSF